MAAGVGRGSPAQWSGTTSAAPTREPARSARPGHGVRTRSPDTPAAETHDMLNRFASSLLLAGAFALVLPGAARAQQTVNFSLGYFTPRGEDARVDGDVLNANRNFLTFDIGDFNGASI